MGNFWSKAYDTVKNFDPLGKEVGWFPDDPYKKPAPKPQSPSPYGKDGQEVQWDETGRPIGMMPKGDSALDWQYEADRRAERRRQALWGDAQNVMRQGADLMQTYRPGGSAALASGIYQNRGAMYGNQAMSTESPDLLMKYRAEKAQEADDERKAAEKRAEEQARTIGLIQAGATIAGAAVGGVGGAALGAAAGKIVKPDAQDPNVGAAPLMSIRGDAAGPSGGSGVSIKGGGNMPGAPQGNVGAGGSSGSGSNLRLPGSRGVASGEKGGAEGLQGGTESVMADGGPMSMFSSQEAAYNAMLANPGGNYSIYSAWAQSPVRSESTMARIKAARFRMANSYYPA